MAQGKFSLLIFDLDGTLVDSEQDLASAINHTRALFQQTPLGLPTIRNYIGSGVKVLVDRALPGLGAQDHERALKDFKEYYGAHLLDHTRLYPGIKEVLQGAGNRIKAVLTNKTESFSKRILEGTGIADQFFMVWGGDTGPTRKPDPDPLRRILAAADCGPAECLMIGDGVNDILAAKGAGIASLAVGYGYSEPSELKALSPEYFAGQPPDILKVLS